MHLAAPVLEEINVSFQRCQFFPLLPSAILTKKSCFREHGKKYRRIVEKLPLLQLCILFNYESQRNSLRAQLSGLKWSIHVTEKGYTLCWGSLQVMGLDCCSRVGMCAV